jgi:arginase
MDVALLLLPHDSGQEGVRLGAGPLRVVDAGLAAALVAGGHRVTDLKVLRPTGAHRAEIASTFTLCREAAVNVAAAVRSGSFPLVLSGNCFAAVGAVSGLDPARLGLVWFDAHGEMNTPDTTASGYLDGMGLATLMGECWKSLAAAIPGFRVWAPEHVALLGGRDFDPPEVARLNAGGLNVVSPGAGFLGAAERALDRLVRRVQRVYIHVDLDVLDAREVQASAMASPGGPTLDEVEKVLEMAHSRFEVVGAGLAGYDPAFDPEGGVKAALTLLTAVVPPRTTGKGHS